MTMKTWKRAAMALAACTLVLATATACGSKGGNSDGATTTKVASSDDSSSGDASDATTAPDDEEPATMPDLVDMTQEEAEAALADLGVDETKIQIEEQESLEDPGTVVDQVPSSGSKISGTVTLTVAKAVGPVPDFEGQQISDVRDWADAIGITVREEQVLNDELPEGQVVATTPAAGQDATSEIKVQVATKPVVGSLVDVEMLSHDGCYGIETGEASVNGDFLQDSLMATPSSNYPCVMEYDFGRDWKSLKFTAGIGDDSPSDTKVRIEVFADGKELLNKQVAFAETSDIDLDVTDVLRLRIQVTWLQGDPYYDTTAVLGNLRRIGSPDSVPTTTTTTP